jgi:peptide/nickel transport system permease protein
MSEMQPALNPNPEVCTNEELALFDNLQKERGQLYEFWRAFSKNRLAVASCVILVLIILSALAAPLLATHNPTLINLSRDYVKQPPSSRFFFGTDYLGRDVFSRMLFGTRVSLMVGLITMLISVLAGTAYGAVSGYYGGRVDSAMMRLVDILLSLPTLFLLIILAAFIKPNFFGIALIIGFTSWMSVARLVRGEFLSLKEREFVEASRALGYSNSRIIFRHILPNVKAPIIVNATLMVAYAILIESTLSFLGLGVQPPQFSWGSMLNSAQDLITLKDTPWNAFFPGLAIFVTVLCFNFFGDGLRDALDPHLKNIKEK